MNAPHHIGQELAHMGRMISQLERMTAENLGLPTTRVTSLPYWRARLEALAAEPPAVLKAQMQTLLGRRDALALQRSAPHAQRNDGCWKGGERNRGKP